MPIAKAVDLVLAEWAKAVDRGEITAATAETHGKVLATFVKFMKARGVVTVADIDARLLHEWTRSLNSRGGGHPTANMVNLRRSVARSLYRTLALLGITDQDITVAVSAPPRPPRAVAPLNEAQVGDLKQASLVRRGAHSGSSKAPAALALALLGAQSKEIPAVRVCDVNFLEGSVFVHSGGDRTFDRWLPLDDPWAYQSLAERVQYLQKNYGAAASAMPVAYLQGRTRGGAGLRNPAAATSNTLDKIFKDAGVKQPGRVRIASLSEYVALRVYRATGDLMEVAYRLGMSSLDAAAHIVDDAWLARRLSNAAGGAP